MKSYNSNEVCLKQGKKNVIIRDWRWGKEMDVFLCVCVHTDEHKTNGNIESKVLSFIPLMSDYK